MVPLTGRSDMLLLVGLGSHFRPVARRYDVGATVARRRNIGSGMVVRRRGTGGASSGVFSNCSEGIWTVDAGRSIHRASPPSPLALAGTATRSLGGGQ